MVSSTTRDPGRQASILFATNDPLMSYGSFSPGSEALDSYPLKFQGNQVTCIQIGIDDREFKTTPLPRPANDPHESKNWVSEIVPEPGLDLSFASETLTDVRIKPNSVYQLTFTTRAEHESLLKTAFPLAAYRKVDTTCCHSIGFRPSKEMLRLLRSLTRARTFLVRWMHCNLALRKHCSAFRQIL